METDKPEKAKPYAIVIGLDGINGIQTARILADHDVPIIAIATDPDHYCCRTKVCEKILIADTTNEDFIRELETLGPKLDQKAVLFPCDDTNVLLVSRYRQRLEKWFHVMLPDQAVVEKLMNKASFYTYCQENGFSVPAMRILRSRAEAEEAAAELNFPCILKPPLSADPKWGKNNWLKAYKVSQPSELLMIYDRASTLAQELIVQEWISGPDSHLFSCNCYLDDRSKPIATFVARKIRQWPPVVGESSLGEECREDVVRDETVRLLQGAEHRGLGYIEIKRDVSSGEYFILDPNIGRPTGRSAIAEAGGVELLYTMYCDAVGWPLPENSQQTYGGVKWISLRRDLQSALYHWRQGDLSLMDWWRSVRGRKTYALFSWTDPGPFIGDLQRAIRLYFRAEERRKRTY